MGEVYKFFLEIFKKHKNEILWIILVATIGAILTTITPYLYGKLFDLARIPETAISLLLFLIGIWLILNIISNYITNKTSMKGSILGMKIALESESDTYSHFLTLPILFHKKQQKGEILQKIARGAWQLQSFIETISEVLPQILMLLFSLIAMIIIRWELAIIIIIAFIIYSILTIKMTKPILNAQEKENKAFEKRYGEVYDKLYNVFIVKNFVMEEKEKENFSNSLVNSLIPVIKNTSKKSTKLSIIQDMIYSVSFVAVLGSAIFFLRKGNITAGEFVMFFGYVNLAFSPFRFLARIYRTFKRSSVAIKDSSRLKGLFQKQ